MRRRSILRKMRKSVRAFSFALLLCACSASAAFAQDNWLGGAGNWGDGAKWSAGVPTSSSSVYIDHGLGGASSVTMNSGAQCASLTIDSDDSLTMVDGALFYLYGPTISNAGTFSISASSSGAVLDIYGAVTLSGAGALTMSNSSANTIFGYGQISGASLTNQSTIQGAGTINPNSNNSFSNQHIVNANQTTPLILITGSGTVKNTGTLEATNGGILLLEGDSYGNGTFDNTGGGIIQAGAGSIVQLYDTAIVKNGNLTGTSTGITQCNGSNGFCKLDGVILSGTHQVIAGGEYLANTITNNGSFQMGTSSNNVNLDMVGNVTLKGTGTLTMSNLSNNQIFGYGQQAGATLTNQSTIQGSGSIVPPGSGGTFTNQGKVIANQTTPLTINAGYGGLVTNSGTLQAANGATLMLLGDSYGGGTFDNTGGTIQAAASSIVQLYDTAIIKNGTLTATSPGVTQCNGSNGFCKLDGVTITGAHQVIAGGEFLANTVTNNGSFLLGTSTNNMNLDIVGSATLKGTGTLTMSNNPNNAIFGYGQQSGATFTNQSTIQGAGNINPGSTNSFINENIVSANQTNPIIINGNFTNTKNGTVVGTLKVAKKSTLYIGGGLFTNFSGNTLTGGKYMVTGTLAFDGANIVNNAAAITLTGSTAQITNQSAANALANFATNMSAGSFSVMSGKTLTTTITNGIFTNAGKVTVGANSGFQVTAPAQVPPVYGTYTQTAGTTTVDGVLTAVGGATIKAGKLFGKGTIAASVASSGSVTAGDSLTKAGILSPSSYTQNATGTLNVQIGGLTAGTQYSQLAVGNGASLNGTLSIKLINSFVPAIGNTFTILTSSARTGQFATVKGLSINSSEHFQVSYDATSVTLTVVTGP